MSASSSYSRPHRRSLKSRTGTFARRYGATYTPKTYGRKRSGKYRSYPRSALKEPAKGMDTYLSIPAGNVVSTTNTNDSSFVLNLVAPGTGSWNRIGRVISSKSIRIKGTYILEMDKSTNTLDGNTLRAVVVWDKQPCGSSVPTFQDIFGTTTQAGSEGSHFLAPPAFDNMNRFRVLHDRTYTANPSVDPPANTTSTNVFYEIAVDEYLPLKNLVTNYSGQSDPQTISDISSGALYIFFRASKNVTQSRWLISNNTSCRLRYED